MRRFALYRHEDASGVSGTGHVADGVQFFTRGNWPGKCVIYWRTQNTSVAVYDSIDAVKAIHGHDGRTEILWPDHICTASYKHTDGQRLSCCRVPGHTGDHHNADTGFAFALGATPETFQPGDAFPAIEWAHPYSVRSQ